MVEFVNLKHESKLIDNVTRFERFERPSPKRKKPSSVI